MFKARVKKWITAALSGLMAVELVFSSLGTLNVKAEETVSTVISTDLLVSALISGNQVVVTGSISTQSEDGILHLYAQEPYESGTSGVEVATAPNGSAKWTFDLGYNTANSNLTKKFTVVVVQNGVLTSVGNSIYITNPEAIATVTATRMDNGIKGLLPAAELLTANNLTDLGIQQVTYNMLLGRVVSGTGINYTYNGKTYSFSAQYIGEYDIVASRMNAQGIQVTFVVLNDLGSNTTLIHPQSRTGASANYYALNAATEDGVELLEAVMSFLAERYSGYMGCGQVDNWIIGNEVNAYSTWNYMSSPSLEYYTLEYANAFRVCYNAIKAKNANANVYVGTDQQWAQASNASLYYGSRPFLVAFNTDISTQGNIDWRLAIHPYNVPLTDPNNWTATSNATHSQDSPYVTMQNIDVVTDFLSLPAMLSPTGNVRTVKLSEVGYTSTYGEEQQAIAVTYAYLQSISNQYVDGLIISRELDHSTEIAQGLAVGLLNQDGTEKLAYEYYKHAGDPTYASMASALAGVDLTSLLTFR